MIHAFRALDLNIILDVESGAVHVTDDLIYDMLVMLSNGSAREDIVNKLAPKYSPDDIRDAFTEIDNLISAGQLFAPVPYTEAPAVNPQGIIKAMCLHVSHDCNLRCKYCFASTGDFGGERALMDAATGKKALDFLVSKSGGRKNLEVDFFGGEPLMNFGAVKSVVEYGRMLEKKHNKTIKFTITTNGLGLTDEIIDYFNSEMENVVLSLDGRPDVHDKMRPCANGKGSYNLIADNILNFSRMRGDKSHYIRGTYTAYNLDFARDVLYLAEAGFRQISIEPVVAPAGTDYSIKDEHLPRLFEEYEYLMQEYLKRRKEGQEFNFFHFNVDLTGGPCLAKRLTGCGAGNEYVAVTPGGDIYPCHQFVGQIEFKMGNIYAPDSFNTDMQKVFAGNNVVTKPECSACWAKYYCSGGCAANAYYDNGHIDKPYRIGCELLKKRTECAIAIFIKEREEKHD
ncbi:MAG TPA: thioether cross-link-forming SCIFF peptide maturase [Clostridia bacterium]|nr:thioether cross-link-forming SCIFF peptide maturase [Clostridia bacterium]